MIKVNSSVQTTGLGVGLGLLIAAALFVAIAANHPQSPDLTPPGPIEDSVVAPAQQLSRAFAAVAAHVKPAVVSVYSEKRVRFQSPDFQFPFGDDFFHQFFGQQSPSPPHPHEYSVPQRGEGTGMILDRQGHILTNYHVVADVDTINVQLADKRVFKAKIAGADPKTDVAVLELTGSIPDNLPTVELGDSDALEVGHLVMAIGSPFGLAQTVTTGIVSAKGRSNVGITDYEDFLQTDAPINPGNSGGPLINMRGEVIGMNSAIETQVGQFAGVGFAIPINLIKTMLPSLTAGKPITRGVIGISIQDVTKELADQFGLPEAKGALISQVNKDSPAEKAGLKAGDVIVRYDATDVSDTSQLRRLVAATAPGTSVKVTVIRDGKQRDFMVTVGAMQGKTLAVTPGASANQLTQLGLNVQTLNAELARRYGIEASKGVVITAVEPGSLAATYGLEAGDLIVEADHKPVTNTADLQSLLSRDKKQILLLVKRKTGSIFLVLKFM